MKEGICDSKRKCNPNSSLISLEISFEYLLEILRLIYDLDLIIVCFTTLPILTPLLPATLNFSNDY